MSSVLVLLAVTTDAAVPTRVLHFPSDRVAGSVLIREDREYRGDIAGMHEGWKKLAEAVGDLEIPAGKQVQLQVSIEASRDLSFLDRLGADDLYLLNMWLCPVDDANMAHVRHLTGLRGLFLIRAKLSEKGFANVRPLTRLRHLNASHTPIGDEGLAHLSGLTNLEFVRLFGTRITDRGLAHLSALTNIEGLQLAINEISDAGLHHLEPLKKLRILDFGSGNAITDAGLAHLAGLTNLQHLGLTFQPITDRGLVSLRPLRTLKTLYLSDESEVTDAGLAELRDLPSLEMVTLPERISAEGFARLAGHPSIRQLEAKSDAHLAQAARFPALRELILGTECTDVGMDHVGKITGLQTLYFNNAQITDAGLAKVTGLKELKILHLNDTRVTDGGLKILNGFPRLEELQISGLRGGTQGLAHVSGLMSLASFKLTMSDRSVSADQALAGVAGLTNLQSLALSGVSHLALPRLAALTNLLSLTLNSSQVRDETMPIVARLSKLEYLKLDGRFTDESIPHLTALNSLNTLDLGGEVEISDSGRVRLAAMPAMQNLTLNQGISRAIPLQPGDAAPDLEVVTLDGRTIRLKELRGKVVLLYFYGTWCGPCMASTPKLKALHEDLRRNDKFEMISLSFAEPDLLVRRHVERNGLEWPQVSLGLNSSVVRDYRVTAAPSYYLVHPDGKIITTSSDLDKIREAVQGASVPPAPSSKTQ